MVSVLRCISIIFTSFCLYPSEIMESSVDYLLNYILKQEGRFKTFKHLSRLLLPPSGHIGAAQICGEE